MRRTIGSFVGKCETPPSGDIYYHKTHCFMRFFPACGADSIYDFSQPQNLPQNFSALRFTAEFTAEFFRLFTAETAEFTVEKKSLVPTLIEVS
jgi:hypothetical protein